MNIQIFFNMNVAFEKQTNPLRESSDKAFLQASFQQPGAYVSNWAVCKHVVKSPEFSQF